MKELVPTWDRPLIARVRRLFDLYALGRSPDLPKANRDAAVFWAIVTPMAGLSLIGWIAFYLITDAASLWPAALTCALFNIALVLPWIARRSRVAAELFATFIIICSFSVLMWIFGEQSGLHLALLPTSLIFMLQIGTRRPFMLAICIAPIIFLTWLLPIWFAEPQPFTNATPWLLDTIRFANTANLVLITIIMMLPVLRRAEIAEDALAAEHDRSEALLANLLPAEIATRLKTAPGAVIADESPAITILFADIVGFTPKAETMKPEALVAYLNRVFSTFDDLTATHGLEKIKTIGDAYMVVAGIPTSRPDHAEAAADLALDMIAAVDRLTVEMEETVAVRIGLHTGPAVAGVIGTTKVFYDVWGDAVNTAARMESHGEAGRIQVTAATRDALGDGYAFEARGVVDIKGKGSTETFWLTGRR
ncbi:MAG: adenylate/guanylate cyclase domain-containing protein [Pseudomonadota bacterium]